MKSIIAFCSLCFFSNLIFAQSNAFIKKNDHQIHYRTFGEGTPVLIINGGPGMSSEGFIPLAEMLAQNNKTIIYDQRGTGKSTLSELTPKTLTMDAMVADIEILRKHLKIENWTIMGHSFGGMLAAHYATKHPKYINGLILSSSGGLDLSLLNNLNITGNFTQVERDSLNYWSQQIAQGDTTYHAALQRGKFLAPAYLYDKSFVDVVAHRLTQGNMTINRLVWQDMRENEFDCKEALKSYTKPVLIIQGKEDIIDKEIAHTMHAVFSNSELFFIEKCAHYGWLEQPDIYLPKIKGFLAEIPTN